MVSAGVYQLRSPVCSRRTNAELLWSLLTTTQNCDVLRLTKWSPATERPLVCDTRGCIALVEPERALDIERRLCSTITLMAAIRVTIKTDTDIFERQARICK